MPKREYQQLDSREVGVRIGGGSYERKSEMPKKESWS